MAHGFTGTTVVDRPIDDVFAFLADGTNDRKFSPRVQEIRQTTNDPIGVGTAFESTVKDAGMKSSRKFELTEFERRERSAGLSVRKTWSRFLTVAMTWRR